MKSHVNIPIFIPHLGCPNQCVFCNQRTISGVEEFDSSKLTEIIEQALSTVGYDTEAEIAFFGGSFTGIDRNLMLELLEIAYGYVKSGRVTSIRCSTRPDYIDEEILAILKKYGVKVIELGLQSTSDDVLLASKRGHDRECERRACEMIVNAGFELVGQMMIGLPESTPQTELETAQFIVDVGAVGARIYPTVVFYGTELCDMATSGVYVPIEVEEAVARSASVFDLFIKNNVRVIRVGLCASEKLESDSTYHSGPNHPAIGELVINEFYRRKITARAKELSFDSCDILKITVARGMLSKAIGQKKRNKLLIKEQLGIKDMIFAESDNLTGYELILTREVGEMKCT